jgi:hypothetical protein
MSRWLAEILRRPLRPLASVALLILAPKCAVCVLAYAGIGAALGLRGQEICGAAVGSESPWASSLAVFGVALGIVGLLASLKRRRNSGQNHRSHS